jgi:N,N-dimethylformamidase beta subunit-like, C-terminal
MKCIVGYTDRISAAPGDTVRFMVSSEDETPYRADIVRLVSGDLHPAGAGFKEKVIETAASGDYPGRRQVIHAGSFVHVPADPAFDLSGFTLQAFIWPTTPEKGRQVLLARWSAAEEAGYALVIDDGAAGLLLGDGRGTVRCLPTGRRLLPRHWYFVAASYDGATGRVRVRQEPLLAYPGIEDGGEIETACDVTATAAPAPFTIAAVCTETDKGRLAGSWHYNGKIARPRVADGALDRAEMARLEPARLPESLAARVVAAWDFSQEMAGERIVDIGRHGLDGRAHNLPARAMTGPGWTGEEQCWRHAPEHYDAIHFHEDDVYDAGWQADFELKIPRTLRSGVYAARLRTEGGDDHVPFFVRPPRGQTTSDLALLIPTASYMAYANEHGSFDTSVEQLSGIVPALKPEDLFINEHREYGLSFYDTHADGSGVCYSSRLRPILNMRPGYTISWVGPGGSAPWQFNADLHIVDWLEAIGHGYDVVTDEDLHAEGAGLLAPYRAVMTATHPEYYSTAMWDGVRGYLAAGGRLIYMGGNGFYWRVAYNDALPGVIELRRTEDGIRDWEAEAGEYYHSFSGEYGGLWRRLGRPPQVLVGVGMSGQGFDVCGHFRRASGSLDPRLAFVFDGVEGDIIGDFGVGGGGAAGLELDRYDARLGSPPHAVVLASSENLTNLYYPGPEDVNSLMPQLGADDSESVRGDMVFFETPNDGAVFSMSSISWAGSLCHNGYDNCVSRVTDNVLRRFLDPAPFG